MQEPKHVLDDVALIFEGGGMRASYTSAVAVRLMEMGIRFGGVYGVSAGSSCTVNFISEDPWRTKESFVGFAADPDFGGWGKWLQHKGMFNAHYIYQEIAKPDGPLPFKLDDFHANPTQATVTSFMRDTGETVYWTKKDLTDLESLMVRVRASSSLPFFMPPPTIDGVSYYDGGLGESSGIVIDRAIRDGFTKFFVVHTQKREYRKEPESPKMARAIKTLFWRRPHVVKALLTRAERYNATLDKLFELERDGNLYLFSSEKMSAHSSTTDVSLLQQNFDWGYEQALSEEEAWGQFLGI